MHCQRVVDSVTLEPTNDVIKVVESAGSMTDLCFEFEVLEVEGCEAFKGDVLPEIDVYAHPPLPGLILDRFRTT